MSDRLSACAGRFFPADQKELIEMLDQYIDRTIPKQKAIGVMCPHAGYVYSGMVTGKCLSSVESPDCVIIMCPVEETGRNSVKPSTMAMMIVCIQSICLS